MRPLERKWDLAQRPHVDRSVPGPGPGTGRPPGIVDGATGQESGGAFPASGYPVDPAFPQLEVASDPARMLEIFRAQLKPVPGKACRILDCSPFRFRCRQSTTRCVLQYTLRVAEPSTGRQWDQWVTGLLYAEQGEAEERWRRLRSSRAVAPIPEPWQSFEAVGFIPELDMVVEVFPFDRRLPQLGRVLEAASRDLEPLLLARLGPGHWQVAAPTIEPKRYRTELGAVLRYTLPAREVESGQSEHSGCYLKVYRDERGRETFELLRSWWQRAERAPRSYDLVRPLAYWEDLRTLVLEEAPGISLRELLLEDRDPVAAVRAVARALAAFHHDDLDIPRYHTLADQLGQVRRASAIVEWACPQVRAEVRGIIAAVAAGLKEVPARPIHTDFKAEHTLLSYGRVLFVDLDAVALGDPVRDAAHFCSYLAGRVGLDGIPPAKARSLAFAFATEYFSHVPKTWRAQFALHYAGALVEVACGIFRHQEHWWLEKAEEAVEEAGWALAGGLEEWSLGAEPETPVRATACAVPDRAGDLAANRDADTAAASLALPHLDVMQVLWTGGEATARQVAGGLRRPLAHSAVTALLDDLARQGVVSRRLADGQGLYRAAVGHQDVQRSFVQGFASFADQLFEGDMAALVSQLLRVRDVRSPDLARVIALVETMERERS